MGICMPPKLHDVCMDVNFLATNRRRFSVLLKEKFVYCHIVAILFLQQLS